MTGHGTRSCRQMCSSICIQLWMAKEEEGVVQNQDTADVADVADVAEDVEEDVEEDVAVVKAWNNNVSAVTILYRHLATHILKST